MSWRTRELTGPQRDLILTVGITFLLAACLFLRIHFMAGPIGSDDSTYLDSARLFPRLPPAEDSDLSANRLIFMLLVVLPFKIFGHPIYSVGANIFISWLIDLVVVWFCLKKFGKYPALLALIVMVANPIGILFSGMILPDTILTLFTLLTLVALHQAASEDDPRRYRRALVFAGALTDAAYLCKEPGVLLIPVAVGWILFFPFGKPWRARFQGLLAYLAGFLLVTAVEVGFFTVCTGDLLYKWRAYFTFAHKGAPPGGGLEEFLSTCWNSVVHMFWNWKPFLSVFHLGLPVMLLAALVNRRMAIFPLFGLFVFLYLVFGSASLTRLLPLPFQLRYFLPVIPCVAISAALLLSREDRLPWRWARGLLPLLLLWGLMSASLGFVDAKAGINYNAPLMNNVRTALEVLQDEDKPVYIEPVILSHLSHFAPRSLMQRVQTIPRSGPLLPGFYLLDPRDSVIPPERVKEVLALKTRMRVSLDWRIANRFRTRAAYERFPPAAVVLEKESTEDRLELPDLTLSSIRCRDEPAGSLSCELTIQNQSPYPAPAFTVRISYDDAPAIAPQGSSLQPLSGWCYASFLITVPRTSPPPDRLHVRLDADDQIQERDETNNDILRSLAGAKGPHRNGRS